MVGSLFDAEYQGMFVDEQQMLMLSMGETPDRATHTLKNSHGIDMIN